jgi:predicted O-methyltransferase YrrM
MSMAWKIRRHLGSSDGQLLRRLLGDEAPTAEEVEAYLDELRGSRIWRAALQEPDADRWLREVVGLRGDAASAALRFEAGSRVYALLLYVVLRVLRPEVVVETGCFTGWHSALVLHALAANERGMLHTIDLPAAPGRFSQLAGARDAGLPDGVDPGFLVPEELTDRWSLTLADVRDALPSLLDELGGVDVFFHDSDHTYEHMMWEYASAWRYLTHGGLLVSDDVSWNTAFRDFARGVGEPIAIHRAAPNLAALRRRAAARMRAPELRVVHA